MAGDAVDPEGLGLGKVDGETASPVVAPTRPRLLKILGPGLITGASDDDPSGIGTYSQAGAQFGYGMAWTLLLSYPLMVAIQIVSARIGRVTGHGIAGVLRLHYPQWLLSGVVLLLLAANVINLGADLGAMADATTLLVAGRRWVFVLLYAAICISLQLFLQYTRYVAVLKWLCAALLAYFVSVAFVHVDWRTLALHLVWPGTGWSHDGLAMIVAVFGTTISPYLFFWQSAEEVEDIHVYPRRIDLFDAPRQGPAALHRIGVDTTIGMAFSNLVALAILVTTAATLGAHGMKTIQTSAQAAAALRPLAGRFAATIFTLGILGTGLLAVPVLAGSAAYAIGEARRWPTGLGRRPKEAQAFYATLVVATLVGMAMNFMPIDPIAALFWSAVINGVVAVPVMAVMMLIVMRRDIMGAFVVGGTLRMLGWITTAFMGVVAVAMVATAF
jgi:NRAMP (natural resistance-associated macrophage protein)-like metal ion transporter